MKQIYVSALFFTLGAFAMSDGQAAKPNSNDPELEEVSDLVKYNMFFMGYTQLYGGYMTTKVSSADASQLSASASQMLEWEEEEAARYQHDFVSFCSNRAGKTTDTLAREYDEISNRSNARRVENYKQHVQKLSPPGRLTVEKFVNDTIAKDIKVAPMENAKTLVANQKADEFLFMIDGECQFALTGDYTPEYAEAKERAKQRIVELRDEGLERLIKQAKEGHNAN